MFSSIFSEYISIFTIEGMLIWVFHSLDIRSPNHLNKLDFLFILHSDSLRCMFHCHLNMHIKYSQSLWVFLKFMLLFSEKFKLSKYIYTKYLFFVFLLSLSSLLGFSLSSFAFLVNFCLLLENQICVRKSFKPLQRDNYFLFCIAITFDSYLYWNTYIFYLFHHGLLH